jgi:hypothetical protein
VLLLADASFDVETAEAGVGFVPVSRRGVLSRFERTDPTKRAKAFHSVFTPSENLEGPCSKSTTNAKVKAASKASRNTPESKLLMAGN